jgi:hypothetical protein
MNSPGFMPDSAASVDGAGAAAPSLPGTASERLLASRARLRAAILQRTEADARAQFRDAVDPDASTLEKLRHRWQAWRPFGVAGVLAARTADAVVGPIVQRHPVSMTLGAAVVGGILVWSRPWRWTLGSALLAGLLPRLFKHGGTPARSSASLPAWLAIVSAIATSLVRPRDEGAPPPAADALSPNPRGSSR